MSVTNTQFATNSYKVTISNELIDSNNVIAGVNTAITTLGWTAYDTVNQTTYSPIVTKVYRVLNADGNSYKYAILRWNTLKLQLNLSTCESWNNTTDVATNESWHNDGCFYHGYDLRYSMILVNATARHLLIQSYIINEPGHWAGIFEAERIASEDTSANTVPNYFYTNSLMFGTPWGIEGNRTANTSQVMAVFPRTADNQTDYAAASVYAPTTSRGMWPPYFPSGNTGNTGANSVFTVAGMDPNNLHLGTWYLNIGAGATGQTNSASISTTGGTGTWGWDGGAVPISPISIDAIKKHMPFGRIYDMSVTRPMGGQLDTTYFTCNTTGGWVENTGSNTELLIMPFNGGFEQYYSNNYPALAPDPSVFNSGIKVSWSNNFNVVYSTTVSVGNNVWAAGNNGVWVWNQTAGSNTTANIIYFNSNGILDIMFDGSRSIYGTTNTGLIQIDTETYATNTITSSNMTSQGGCGYLNMDNSFIYATNRTSSVTPYCHLIYRSNNTVAPNVITLAASVSLNVASGWSTPMPDYAGFVYLSTTPGTVSNQQKRMLVANVQGANSTAIGFNLGTANSLQPWYSTAAAGHTATFEYDNIWVEYNSGRIYHFQANTGSSNFIEYSSDRTFTQLSNANAFTVSWSTVAGHPSQLDYYHKNATLDYRGDLNIIQHRGQFHIQYKRPGVPVGTLNASMTRFVLHHPAPNLNNTYKIQGFLSLTSITGNTAAYCGIGLASSNLQFGSNYTSTNGIRVQNSIFNGNVENRIQTSAGHFNLYPFGGTPTGRLLIKA